MSFLISLDGLTLVSYIIFMDRTGNKEKILDSSINLFFYKGYDNVSMRDIAAAVGIKAASIYNHYQSKKDILKSIYNFYTEEHNKVLPPMEKLFEQLETTPLYDVLVNLGNYWPPYEQDKMDRIILIASQRLFMDKESETFIKENFFKPINEIWIPLLNHAVKTGLIEKVDADTFTQLASYYAYSSVELNHTDMKVDMEQWNKGLVMLLSLLKPVNKGKTHG
jgi:AcrR family transcriptional regulator